MKDRTLLLSRTFAILVGTITILFIVLGLTQNADLFGPADIVLGFILIIAAMTPKSKLACLGMLIGYSYTAGVFSLSITATFLDGTVNIASTIGLIVCIIFIYVLGRWLFNKLDSQL
ncbi:hypothetical protein [Chroogloeocystis siderophila]|uniref:Uncharacterized protein n=1 Tax=Chroogloeocystis siderophila 5.2 s.c.1 TaxID=247279 RepID=A0A1U7HZR6_9CHRO|nr:hypothetical protein [Chroogloeocystis siderophila]OKH29123.1 hypothetical protein NIES1031_00520 [Chroogloeocystis siderophila 5.2 s.c.1]